LLAVLVAAGLPFAAFVYFVADVVERKITEENVEFYLQSKAGDVADKINLALRERQRDIALLASEPEVVRVLTPSGEEHDLGRLEEIFNTYCEIKVVYKLIVVFDRAARSVVWNTLDAQRSEHPPDLQKRLEGKDCFDKPWFQAAMRGETTTVGWHLDELDVGDVTKNTGRPSDYSFAFAAPVFDSDPSARRVLGAVYCLVGWSSIQNQILDTNTAATPGAPVDRYKSGYAFLWEADANLIIGHPNHDLYGKFVSEPPVNLPQVAQAVRANPNGIVHYRYPEATEKRAAFRQTLLPSEGGFGWIVGVGVEDEEVFAPARVVRLVLSAGTVLGIAALLAWLLVTSRAITRPLTELAVEAERIAGGDLAARVTPSGPAETVVLGRAFNHMAGEIARQREKIVKIEKEAAWREMARQVSHEIKNPLTPMKLCISLLDKAWREKSPEFDAILARSIATTDRQIESLRRIAEDFKAFAGTPNRHVERVDPGAVVDEVILLYSAAAVARHVEVVRSGEAPPVDGDREELKRAVVNLLDNAMQAAPDGSRIDLRLDAGDGRARIRVTDRGPGIPPDQRARLFTPYFSTRTHGTGLGLAIVRRIAEDHGGRAYLDEADPAGTTMTLELPVAK
jgi:signal transduction histidine kinase